MLITKSKQHYASVLRHITDCVGFNFFYIMEKLKLSENQLMKSRTTNWVILGVHRFFFIKIVNYVLYKNWEIKPKF